MTPPRPLPRLAQLAHLLDGKRELFARLQRAVDGLERIGVEVVGQKSLLAMLQTRLGRVRQALQQLGQDGGGHGRAARTLAELEDLLAGPFWALAEQVAQESETEEKRQEGLLNDCSRDARLWRGRIDELKRELHLAGAVGAPIGKEQNELRRLDALVKQAERALDDPRRRGLPLEPIQQLAREVAPFAGGLQALAKKRQAAAPFNRHAELLFLQSPLDADYCYRYQVLLRTPSEPGRHGINIQGSSTLAQEDRDGLGQILSGVTEAVNRGVRNLIPEGEPPAGERPAVTHAALIEQLGDLMHRLFMPAEMQTYLIDTACAVTVTTNDQVLPWELMSYKKEGGDDTFLCLEKPVARMPLGHAFPRRARAAARVEKVRFLLVHADPRNSLAGAAAEIRQIKEELEQTRPEELAKGQLEIQVLAPPPAPGQAADGKLACGRELNDALRGGDYDVIHYAGHAVFNPDRPDLSGLLLHSARPNGASKEHLFFAQKIRRLTEGQPLIFLNACESSRTANETPVREVTYLQEKAEGLASAFIYSGARACIGALWPIHDDAAARFAIEFYLRALDGQTIGEALRLARLEIKERFPDRITWAAFVLYGDPTARLPSVAE